MSTYKMERKLWRYISLGVFIALSFSSFAQKQSLCPESSVKKSNHYLEDAKDAKKSRKPFTQIVELVNKSLVEDSANGQAYKFLAETAYAAHEGKAMSIAYIKLIELCPDATADAYYRLANYQYETKEFAEAIKNFQSFLDFNKVNEENALDANQKITRANLMMHPVPFNPIPLKNVSTGEPEYLAIISPDQDFCFFTRRFEETKRGALTSMSVEKFMMSKKVNDEFDGGQPMPFPFNKSGNNNEGGASISIDNKHLFFTVNKNGNFDIYTSDESNGKWSEPRSLSDLVNDKKLWDSQPSVSPDGKKIYFASFRDSINETSDIYLTQKDENGNWGKPYLLGSQINTKGNERTPFIHPDNKTFYFSSDNLPGMGGFDIYMCKMNNDGSFSDPINLGYPINTEGNEVGFFVSTDGKKGYFASDHLRGPGGYDIFEFELPEKARPERVLFLKGDLKDDDNKTFSDVKIELKNSLTKEIIDVGYDTLSGKYASVVLFNEDYIMTVKKKGFAFNSTYFSKDDTSLVATQKVNVKLKKIEVGQAYPLNNIHFSSSSSNLNDQDKNIITDFADYLKENDQIKLAINGFTDNAGNPLENLTLSEQRAKAVFEFLASCGIDRSRLSYQGFGEKKPLASNETEQGKAQNRRTEFLIISK